LTEIIVLILEMVREDLIDKNEDELMSYIRKDLMYKVLRKN